MLWLVGAVGGLLYGLQGVGADPLRSVGAASVVLSVPNIALAAIFTFAAMMGD